MMKFGKGLLFLYVLISLTLDSNKRNFLVHFMVDVFQGGCLLIVAKFEGSNAFFLMVTRLRDSPEKYYSKDLCVEQCNTNYFLEQCNASIPKHSIFCVDNLGWLFIQRWTLINFLQNFQGGR